MSMEFLTLAFNADISGSKKSVLIALADRANRGGYCFASMADIAYRAGCDRRTAFRAVAELETLGFLVVIRDKGRTNHYMILPDSLSTTSDTEPQEKVIHTGDIVTKTSDILSKTSDMRPPKPNITQLTQKRAREESVKMSPPIQTAAPNRQSKNREAAGRSLRGIKEILSVVAPARQNHPPR